MSAGRPALRPRSQISLRIDKEKLLELYTYRPQLRDASGGTKYGALNAYFTKLMVEDIERIKEKIRGGEGK